MASKLAVVEDPEGWHVAGLRSRLVRNPDELLQAFEEGCSLRDHGFMDLGSVHERTAAVFTVRLAQFNPAAGAEDEDTATVCMCNTLLVSYAPNRTGCQMLEVDWQLMQSAGDGSSHTVSHLCDHWLMQQLVWSGAAVYWGLMLSALLHSACW